MLLAVLWFADGGPADSDTRFLKRRQTIFLLSAGEGERAGGYSLRVLIPSSLQNDLLLADLAHHAGHRCVQNGSECIRRRFSDDLPGAHPFARFYMR
jgi:hypothetical protein